MNIPSLPPTPNIPKPTWVSKIGAELKEDAGGKYYEHSYTVSEKVYVYPTFRVVREQDTPCWVHKPLGYRGKRGVRAKAKAPVVKKIVKKAEVEEW